METSRPVGDLILVAWSARAESGNSWHQLGRWLNRIGATLLLFGMFLTPPWGLFGLVSGIAGLLLCRPPWPPRALLWLGGLLGGWVAMSTLVSVLLGEPGAGRLSSVAYTWLAVVVVGYAGLEAAWRQIALRLTIVVAVAAAVVAGLQFFVGLSDGGFFHVSTIGHAYWISRGFSATHLTYGFVCGLLAVICFQPASVLNLGVAWTWVGRLCCLWGAGLCGSRSASLATAGAVAGAFMLRGRRKLLLGLGVGALLIIMILGRMLLTDTGRVQRMVAGDDGRWTIWQVSSQVIADRPILGIGSRSGFPAIYNEYYLKIHGKPGSDFDAPHAHNWFMTLAAEHGLPALCLQLVLLSFILRFCWLRRHVAPAGWNLAASVSALAFMAGLFEPLPILAVPGLSFHAVLGLAFAFAVCDGQSDRHQSAVK